MSKGENLSTLTVKEGPAYMTMLRKTIIAVGCLILAVLTQSCIHEYPGPVKSTGNIGENPAEKTAFIEVTYDLDWENMLHNVMFEGRAENSARGGKHRIIIEVADRDRVVSRSTFYLSEEEFSDGTHTFKLPEPLGASRYVVSAWYDTRDDDGEHAFEAEDLTSVGIVKGITTDAGKYQCGFASEVLDLTESNEEVRHRLQLRHPGARFEIVAKDVQEFITMQKEALNQGDKFTINVKLLSEGHDMFDAYAGNKKFSGAGLSFSGRMRLPFDDYEELKIAEGFLFCQEEEMVRVQLSITNQSLVTVASTEAFEFPVKRGSVTIVSGNFLTSRMEGFFNVDTVWEGEIEFEV